MDAILQYFETHKEMERFLKFATVGVLGFIIDFGFFNLGGVLFGLSTQIAGTVSFIAAVTSNFIIHRYWTFPDSRSRSVWQQLGQYFLVNIVGLGIRYLIFWLATDTAIAFFAKLALPLPILTSPELQGENFLLAVIVVIVLFWNYFINRYWTYNDVA